MLENSQRSSIRRRPRLPASARLAPALALLFASSSAAATPADRAHDELKKCSAPLDAGAATATPTSGAVDCTVCGQPFRCAGGSATTGGQCTWGAFVVQQGDTNWNTFFPKAVRLYCGGDGGSLAATASTPSQQGAAMDSEFSAMMKGRARFSVGATGESGANNRGGSLPFAIALGKAGGLGGSLTMAQAAGLTQYGGSLRPNYRLVYNPEGGDFKGFLSLAGTAQGLMTTGIPQSSNLSITTGLSVLGGMVDKSLRYGVGLAADVTVRSDYVPATSAPDGVAPPSGWRTSFSAVPVLLAGRVNFGPANLLAVTPALSVDIVDAANTFAQTLSFGVEWTKWMLGLTGFRRANNELVVSLGARYIGRAEAQVAKAAQEPKPAQEPAPASKPEPTPTPTPAPDTKPAPDTTPEPETKPEGGGR